MAERISDLNLQRFLDGRETTRELSLQALAEDLRDARELLRVPDNTVSDLREELARVKADYADSYRREQQLESELYEAKRMATK
jgi:hypothetical protein